jgi:hypothetical protein
MVAPKTLLPAGPPSTTGICEDNPLTASRGVTEGYPVISGLTLQTR